MCCCGSATNYQVVAFTLTVWFICLMIRKTYYAPKWRSPRLGIPRDGMQKFRLKLDGEDDNICTLGCLVDEIHDSGIGLNSTAIEATLDVRAEIIPTYMAQTVRAR